ncbi:MAG: nucleotidyltransferase family protein, partial [Candidatus Nanosalina sp.]
DLDSGRVLEVLQENGEELKGFGVERIGLFGSFVRDEADEDSDLDFLVVLEENTFDDYMGLKLFLEDLFDRDVDLVIESDVREELDHVKRDAEYVTPA